MASVLTQADRDALAKKEARLNKPLAQRMREAGYDPAGIPQITPTDRIYPRTSKAARQWSAEGIDGCTHNGNGEVVFNSASGERNYCKARGYAPSRDFRAE